MIALAGMLLATNVKGQNAVNDSTIAQVVREAKSLRMQVDDIEARFDHVAGLNNSAGVLYGLGFLSVVYYSRNNDKTYLVTGAVLGSLGTAILVLSANTLSNKIGKKKKNLFVVE